MTVLILGGTAEARALAAALAGDGIPVVSSLAGRVARPALPVGEVRVGGFGGVDGLADWLRVHATVAVVDATHPFAAAISGNAAAACVRVGVPLLRLARPGWTAGPSDDWTRVPDVAAAAEALPSLGFRPFLTTGRGGLEAFVARPVTALVRCVDPPSLTLPADWTLLLDRGPYTVDGELALLRGHRADVVVTKDSGGELTVAKLAAARRLGLPVLMVDRPVGPDVAAAVSVGSVVSVASVASVDDAADWVRRCGGGA